MSVTCSCQVSHWCHSLASLHSKRKLLSGLVLSLALHIGAECFHMALPMGSLSCRKIGQKPGNIQRKRSRCLSMTREHFCHVFVYDFNKAYVKTISSLIFRGTFSCDATFCKVKSPSLPLSYIPVTVQSKLSEPGLSETMFV